MSDPSHQAKIPIHRILVGERFRKDFGDITELKIDIKDNGLISPIAVNDITGEGKEYQLLAGERRLRACLDLGWTEMPVNIYVGKLDPMQVRLIELSENIKRKDLTPYEVISIRAEIHKLRLAIYGEKTSTSADAEGTSIRDTAKVLGVHQSHLSRDLQLAELVELMPELKTAKTRDEIVKAVDRAEKIFTEKRAIDRFADAKEKEGAGDTAARLYNAYHVGDFFEFTRDIASNIIDLCEVDPPYGIDLVDKKKTTDSLKTSTAEYTDVPAEEYQAFVERTLATCYRLLKADGWLILWYPIEPWGEMIYQTAIKVGFAGRRMPGIWVKGTGQTMSPYVHLASAAEYFFYFRKGTAAIYKPGHTNLFTHPPVPPQHKIHPTERPIPLIVEILTTFLAPGGRVLVPFLGSGNTILAAEQSSMVAFGTDLREEYRNSFAAKLVTTIKEEPTDADTSN